jgi:hypothetical protein
LKNDSNRNDRPFNAPRVDTTTNSANQGISTQLPSDVDARAMNTLVDTAAGFGKLLTLSLTDDQLLKLLERVSSVENAMFDYVLLAPSTKRIEALENISTTKMAIERKIAGEPTAKMQKSKKPAIVGDLGSQLLDTKVPPA